MYRLLVPLLLAASLLAPDIARAHGGPTDDRQQFIRFVQGKASSRLETAAVTYDLVDSGGSITLMSAIHIADAGYYEALQEALAAYDVVFFEGVRSVDGAPTDDLMTLVSQLQTALGGYLGLAHQKDCVDCERANFRHADLTAEQIRAMLTDRQVALIPFAGVVEKLGPWVGIALKLLDEAGDVSPSVLARFRPRLKALVADALGNGTHLYERLKRPEDRLRDEVIIQARNGYVFEQVESYVAENPGRKVAIFYGAAHMPDFAARVERTYGAKVSHVSWLPAWDLTSPATTPESRPAKEKRKL